MRRVQGGAPPLSLSLHVPLSTGKPNAQNTHAFSLLLLAATCPWKNPAKLCQSLSRRHCRRKHTEAERPLCAEQALVFLCFREEQAGASQKKSSAKMSEPEGVKMSLTCGPGMCDMDTASTKDGPRVFAGGAEGLLKVRNKPAYAQRSSRRNTQRLSDCLF